jgi:hypothetical protein
VGGGGDQPIAGLNAQRNFAQTTNSADPVAQLNNDLMKPANPVAPLNLDSMKSVDPVVQKAVDATPPAGANWGDGPVVPADKGIFGSLLDFAKTNPAVAMGVIQAGGSFISGATSSLTPAQVTALNAQAAANNAAAALSTQQTANLAMPKAVASSTPITGSPAPLVLPGSGLINQPPKTNVTGAPQYA